MPGQIAADGGRGDIALGILDRLLQARYGLHEILTASLCGKLGTHGMQRLDTAAAGEGFFKKRSPAFKHRDQLVTLPFFHGCQRLGKQQGIAGCKALQKALNKYSIEAYTLALEHPYEANMPFLKVADAKTLTSKEKELVAQYDFNRIKLFQMNVDKIVDLKNIEDNYYKVMSGEHLSKGYEPLEAALSALKPIDLTNLTESEKALHKAMNKYTREAYDYTLGASFEQDRPYLAVMDTKTLTNKEKELIAPFDFNKIKLFVEACEKANTI